MKKAILTALVAAVLAVSASAQEQFIEPPRTEANHSVSIDLLGLHYAYEHPLGRTGTIIGRAGVNLGISGGNWRTGTAFEYGNYWQLQPTIEIEPRWYYGLDRRAGKGRNTAGNSGSFLSLRMANLFPGYSSDGYKMTGATTFSPSWGLRRVWNSGLMLEFTTGYRIGLTHDSRPQWWGEDDFLSHLDIGLRLGYKF
jgi:hypothetical protein